MRNLDGWEEGRGREGEEMPRERERERENITWQVKEEAEGYTSKGVSDCGWLAVAATKRETILNHPILETKKRRRKGP